MLIGTCNRLRVRPVLLLFLILVVGGSAHAQVPVISPSTPPVVNQGTTYKFTANVPVTWSMAPGSKGSIDADGTYHAPSTVIAQQSVGGCQLLPNDHIINTRIDSLPVNPNSAAWMAQAHFGGLIYSTTMPFNYTSNSTPTQNMSFSIGPGNNGPFQFDPPPRGKIQFGWYDVTGLDHHMFNGSSATCAFNEMYDLSTDANGHWSIGGSGIRYNGSDYALVNSTNGGVDSAAITMLPLFIHQSEFVNAVATGGTINHAIRVTMNPGAIKNLVMLWPAQNPDYTGGGLIPMGARVRLRSSFDVSRYSAAAQVLLKQLQQYGMILDDNGFGQVWEASAEDTIYPGVGGAFSEVAAISFATSDFEFVDESGLMVNSNSGATTASEAVIATNSLGSSSQQVVLTGVTVGLPKNQMYIQAGTTAQQFTAFVNGTSNTRVTWTMNPTIGTLTSSGLYTPPANVTGGTQTTVTATSAANPRVIASMVVTILPAGSIRIDMAGPCASALTLIHTPAYSCDASPYMDSHGNAWLPSTGWDGGGVNNCGNGSWPNVPDIDLYKIPFAKPGDMRFDITVPNGNYSVTAKLGNSCPYNSLVGQQISSFETQGTIVNSNVDVIAKTGGPYLPLDLSLPATVTNGQLSFVIRFVKGSVGSMLSALEIDPVGGSNPPPAAQQPPAGLTIIQVK